MCDLQFPLEKLKITEFNSEMGSIFEYDIEVETFEDLNELSDAVSIIKQMNMPNTKYIKSLKFYDGCLYLIFSFKFENEEDLMLFKLAYSTDLMFFKLAYSTDLNV